MRLKIWIAVLLTVALASTLAIPVCALEDQMYSAPQYSERQQFGAAYIAQNGRSGPAFWDFNAAQEIGSASGAALGDAVQTGLEATPVAVMAVTAASAFLGAAGLALVARKRGEG